MRNYNLEKGINTPDLTIHAEGLNRSVEIFVEPNDSDQKSCFPSMKEKFWYQVKEGGYESILFEDIIMVESQGYRNMIYLKNRLYPVAMKSALKVEIYKMYFEDYDNFYQLGSSIILNLDYVFRIDGNQFSSYVNQTETLTREISRDQKIELLRYLGIQDQLVLQTIHPIKQSV
jgi:hypothetical protein